MPHWTYWILIVVAFAIMVVVHIKLKVALGTNVSRWPRHEGPQTSWERDRPIVATLLRGVLTIVVTLLLGLGFHALYGSYEWPLLIGIGLINWVSQTYVSLRYDRVV
jgi:hypothetical protein